MSCRLCDGDSTATRHAPLCPNKRPLDVYREAQLEERDRQAAEGGIGCGVLILCCIGAGVARWLGWI